jgi:hypothetical protein
MASVWNEEKYESNFIYLELIDTKETLFHAGSIAFLKLHTIQKPEIQIH